MVVNQLTATHQQKGTTMKFRVYAFAILIAVALCLSTLSFSSSAHTATAKAATLQANQSAQATIQVQSIAVVNNAGFVMNFSVGYLNPNGSASYSAPTDNYPIDQSRTIDVSTLGLTQGTTIFPHVNAILGSTVDGPRVEYA